LRRRQGDLLLPAMHVARAAGLNRGREALDVGVEALEQDLQFIGCDDLDVAKACVHCRSLLSKKKK
jgi:hypothetical protein